MVKASNLADVSESKRAAEKVQEKVQEKVAEKRRALGRGLDSLLPGPRAVPTMAAPPSATAAASAPHATTEGTIAELRAEWEDPLKPKPGLNGAPSGFVGTPVVEEGQAVSPPKPNDGLSGAASVDLVTGATGLRSTGRQRWIHKLTPRRACMSAIMWRCLGQKSRRMRGGRRWAKRWRRNRGAKCSGWTSG